MKWTDSITVNSHDTDINGNARPSAVLRYMQEAANNQLHNLGPSNEYLRENGKAFILSRVGMKIYSEIHSYQSLSVQTWACESRLSSYYRCARILRGEEIIAENVTVWALVGIADRKIFRASEVPMNFETDPMLESDISVHVKIPPQLDFNFCGERKISYGDVDLNRHMNNTNYPDMLCGCIESMDGKRVYSMTINFLGEAALGEIIKIYSSLSPDGTYYFRTERENGSAGITAAAVLVPTGTGS